MPLEIQGLKTSVLQEGFDLKKVILNSIKDNKIAVCEGVIFVITSKVLALSQGRIIDIKGVKPSKRALAFRRSRYGKGKEDSRLIELILREADAVLPGNMILTLKDGILIPEAGIDLSNAPKGYAILWPEKPWEEAQKLRKLLQQEFGVKKLGVIICDSRCQPLRLGTTGVAISWAGFEGVEDCRGEKDIYNETLKVTQKAVADNMASAALLVMGEAAEKTPFTFIKNAPVKFTNKPQNKNTAYIKPKDCIFGGIYSERFINLVK